MKSSRVWTRSLRLFLFLVTIAAHSQTKPTVVIVHGATGGGWDWKPFSKLLENKGYNVYRPTLTGLGERSHLSSSSINLDTHIQDIINVILFEELDSVVLVGHSYGGMVITGVADALASRISQLVYIDAHFPDNGMSAIDTRKNGGVGILDFDQNGFFVPKWLDESQTPGNRRQSMATLTQKIKLKNKPGNSLKGTFILTVENREEPHLDPFFHYKEKCEQLGWKVHTLQADHNPQNSQRPELLTLFLKLLDD